MKYNKKNNRFKNDDLKVIVVDKKAEYSELNHIYKVELSSEETNADRIILNVEITGCETI